MKNVWYKCSYCLSDDKVILTREWTAKENSVSIYSPENQVSKLKLTVPKTLKLQYFQVYIGFHDFELLFVELISFNTRKNI